MNEPDGLHPTPKGSHTSTAAAEVGVGVSSSIHSGLGGKANDVPDDAKSITSTSSSVPGTAGINKAGSKSKYAGSLWKQQKFSAWEARIHLLSLPWYLLPSGVFLQTMALVLYLGLSPIHTQVIPYTNCMSMENTGQKCSQIVGKDVNASCTCQVRHNIEVNLMDSDIYMDFQITNFHQNQRHYIISLDDEQLKGKLFGKDCSSPITPDDRCKPFVKDEKPIYPCGKFANSLLSDDIITMTSADGSPIKWKPVEALGSKQTKDMLYGDPLKKSPKCTKAELQKVFSKPKQWSTQFWDQFLDDGGARSERFIIWMLRPAAFATFNLPYRYFDGSIEACQPNMKKGICKGNYTFKIQYRYDAVQYKGTKSIVISQKRFIKDDSGFLFGASVFVGTLCTCIGLVALIFFFMNREAKKAAKKSQSLRFSNTSIPPHPPMTPEIPPEKVVEHSPKEIAT